MPQRNTARKLGDFQTSDSEHGVRGFRNTPSEEENGCFHCLLSVKRGKTQPDISVLYLEFVLPIPQKMYFIGPRQDKARETEGFFSRWLTQTQKDLNHIFLLSIHRYSRSVDFQFQTSQCSNGAWSGELLDSRHLKDFQGDGEPERWRERDAEGQNAH